MKHVVAVIVVALIASLGLGLAAWRWDWDRLVAENTDSAPIRRPAARDGKAESAAFDDRNVHALGHLEPAGGVLTIGAMAGDRIAELFVVEGQKVSEGDKLAQLASHEMRVLEKEALEAQRAETDDRRAAETAAADARIRLAEVNLKKAQASQAEIDAQQKQVELAQANLEAAQNDLRRMQGLSAALVSRQELERQRLLVQKAEAELAAAQAALNQAQESRQFAVEAAQAELDAARAAKRQVLAAIPEGSLQKKQELAELQAEQTLILAPTDGTILKVFTREGEIIANKPILQMADLDEIVCVAEVYEGDLPRVEKGQPAIITSRAFPPLYRERGVRGVVTRIGRLVATPELRSIDPFAPTDRHVVEVYIDLDEESLPDPSRLANLQVDVTILTPDDEAHDEDSPGVAQSRP